MSTTTAAATLLNLGGLSYSSGHGWPKDSSISFLPSSARFSRGSCSRFQRNHSKNRQRIVAAFAPWSNAHHIVEVAQEVLAEAVTDGPIELPSEFDAPKSSPLQIGGGIVLTGTIAVLLFRSIRRRMKQAKEQRVRSTGMESVKEQAKKKSLDSLSSAPEVETPPPAIRQTVYGALLAGAIAFVLYQFTAAVEANFASRPVSAEYSIRNITITVRTIITGMCYLATFVFAADAIGLTLYGFQLIFNPPAEATSQTKDKNIATETSGTGTTVDNKVQEPSSKE